jgi:ectoine hydroxylase-related dioxygenase (phytanoyl-CoA dioxygenase family)
LVYDVFFLLNISAHPRVRAVVEKVLGSYYILHLQNAIINRPGQEHHQHAWHRDLPYQSFVISKPLAVNALFCLDPFSTATGCSWCVPFSHREESAPSISFIEAFKIPFEAEAGDVMIFDSMLLHQAGVNTSAITRRAINNVYASGILRQQIDLPQALKGKYKDDPYYNMLLGYDAESSPSVEEYRLRRIQKKLR